MCSMIYCFRLKGPCSTVRGKNIFLSAQSNFNYCQKVLSMKTILLNIIKALKALVDCRYESSECGVAELQTC